MSSGQYAEGRGRGAPASSVTRHASTGSTQREGIAFTPSAAPRKRAAHRGVGVGVAPGGDGGNEGLLEARSSQVVERIEQRRAHRPGREIGRQAAALDQLARLAPRMRERRLAHRCAASAGDADGDRRGVRGARLHAHRVAMRERRVLARGAGRARAGSPAAHTPSGETRISEPFDSLSAVCMPRSPRSVVAPTSTGRVVIHSRYASSALSATNSPSATSERASASAISLSSVGWPAIVVHAAVGEVAHAVRIQASDLVRALELDERPEAVADHLAEEAGLRAVEALGRRAAREAERDARLLRRLVLERLPVVAGELRRGGGSAGEAAGEPPAGRAGERDFLALGIEHHAARGAYERHAGGDVVLAHAVDRHRGDAVARGDAREPIGDARHRDVARGRAGARPRARAQRRGAGREDESRPRREGAARDRRPAACRSCGSARRLAPRR